jgi:predicted metal-binding protein
MSAPSQSPVIYVCTTCKRQGNQDSETETEPRPGALLATAAEKCSRGPSAAMRCNGSWTYLFGGLDEDSAGALIEGVRLLAQAADGILPWRGRPEILKRGLIARLPPIGFEEVDA